MAERAYTTNPEGAARPWLQRKASLRTGTPDDAYEREADRAANAVVSGRGLSSPGLSLSRIPVTQVQREDGAKPKSDEDKYKEAAQKLGEAFLETEVGKKLKEQAEHDPLVKGANEAGESFIGTLPGKIITGAAAAGAVATLAATHKELPAQIPDIPLDKITPGLKVKITYEGPVDKPTKAMITFSYTEQLGGEKKPGKTKTELQREENARMARDMAKFRAGLRYKPGTPEAKQQEAEEAALKHAAFSGVGKLPDFGNVKTFPGLAQPPSALSMQFPTPSYGFKPKPFSILDEELKLKPKSETSDAQDQEKKKKEEGTPVQRKAAGDSTPDTAPSLVNDVLAAPGRPLDATTRGFMEARFGHDFSSVRIHTDERAAKSARSVDALAYASGANIVFSGNAYNPHSHAGKHLLAHELAHVIQQNGAATAPLFVQRRNIFESIGIWLGLSEGDFDDTELRFYLDKVSKSGEIEDSYDSDNKARAIVRRWKAGDSKFKLLATQKVVLIKEMLEGPTLGDDEACILDLLELGEKADLRQMFGPGGVSVERLESDLNGDSRTRLDAFIMKSFKGGRDALIKGTVDLLDTPASATPAPAPVHATVAVERKDYVFLMGADRPGTSNPFYAEAERYYRAKLSTAILVKDKRTLTAVLEHIQQEVPVPIGTLYLVTHANEDGTLSFGLDTADADAHLSVTELRDALHPKSGKSMLPKVGGKVDNLTRIEIKGCDLGRTREMVELIDEAFGGAGTVTAPTHEQGFGDDPELGERARRAFRDQIKQAHPQPASVDPKLKGADKKKAVAERKKALAERQKEIDAEIKQRAAEEKKLVDEATMVESLSGPLFQRPGTKLFSVKELQPEIDRLYGHLSAKRRKELANALVAPDGRKEAEAQANGVYQQHGQRLYRRKPYTLTIIDPHNLAEAQQVFGKQFVQDHFTPKKMLASASSDNFEFSGTYENPGEKPFDGTYSGSRDPTPANDVLIAEGYKQLNNPDRYAWRVENGHSKKGTTTLKVVAERVVAYLHHSSLNPSKHEYFMPPESNTDFFVTSIFAPPAEGPEAGAGEKP